MTVESLEGSNLTTPQQLDRYETLHHELLKRKYANFVLLYDSVRNLAFDRLLT